MQRTLSYQWKQPLLSSLPLAALSLAAIRIHKILICSALFWSVLSYSVVLNGNCTTIIASRMVPSDLLVDPGFLYLEGVKARNTSKHTFVTAAAFLLRLRSLLPSTLSAPLL